MPTCSSCGGNFDDTFQFCPYCGSPRPEPKETTQPQKAVKVDVVSHEPSSSLDCPKCHRIDSVAKVTAIVQGGTHQINGQIPVSYTSHDSEGWHSGTSYERYHATQQSTLASRLMPPQKPTKEFHALAGINCLPLLFAPFIFIGGLSVVFTPSIGTSLTERLGMALFIVLYVAFLVGIALVSAHLDKPLKARHAVNVAAWEYSLSRWGELYYCSRDDCLFIPGEGVNFNVLDLHEAIKWQPVKKLHPYWIKPFWEWGR